MAQTMNKRPLQYAAGAASLAVIAFGAWTGLNADESESLASSSITTSTTTATSSSTTISTATTSAPRDLVLGNGNPVTLAFGGDVHFEGILRTSLQNKPESMLDPIAPTLRAADISMVNLETAVTTTCDAESKAYVFRTPPTTLNVLADAGVDVVSLANNHGRDCGAVGLSETLAARSSSPIPMVGVGANATEAFAPAIVERNGQRIAFFGASDVIDSALIKSWSATAAQPGIAHAKDEELLVAAITAVRPVVDTIVVYLHYGQERQTCPNGRQKSLARLLTDAGADVVVGSHAHRLQGAGYLTSSTRAAGAGAPYVAYGLGNYVFYTASGPGTTTGTLQLTVTGRLIESASWSPAVIRSGVPTPLAEPAAATAVAEFDQLRACTDLTAKIS
jgi:poly-gamma-glutamate capsule biosynthesis protein CapA/YwtB (metallophosphatase superfamily)